MVKKNKRKKKTKSHWKKGEKVWRKQEMEKK